MLFLLALLIATCTACTECPDKAPPFANLTLFGRDERQEDGSILRRATYRVKIPNSWSYTYPENTQSIQDTKKAILNCTIENISIKVHTFPSNSLQERIAPDAQIRRWKAQIGGDTPSLQQITPVSRGGFYGLLLESTTEKSVLAWSMQLDPMLYQKTRFLASTKEALEHTKQLLADYTIKAVGPLDQIARHKQAIMAFAKSFELIAPLPNL